MNPSNMMLARKEERPAANPELQHQRNRRVGGAVVFTAAALLLAGAVGLNGCAPKLPREQAVPMAIAAETRAMDNVRTAENTKDLAARDSSLTLASSQVDSAFKLRLGSSESEAGKKDAKMMNVMARAAIASVPGGERALVNHDSAKRAEEQHKKVADDRMIGLFSLGVAAVYVVMASVRRLVGNRGASSET